MRPGTRFGPRSIREASLMYRGLQDVASEKTSVNVDTHIARRLKPEINIGDLGDFHVNPQDIMKTTESVIEGISDIVKLGGVPVLLGGDHYLAYPGFEGLAQGMMERGENPKLGYVHIDTHTDFRDRYGELGRYNHGTCARRISENSVVSYKNMSWVGLNGTIMDAGHLQDVQEAGTEDVDGQRRSYAWDGARTSAGDRGSGGRHRRSLRERGHRRRGRVSSARDRGAGFSKASRRRTCLRGCPY